ncbi:MAG TPA: tRNA preQ1(34) S-adenosylmethionine ribosyltransferase-isomerase QueA [Candidatus Polarisedimenticolaceae bacterium]|nr:tRNA preQ1(34) S-adenosylmethionine ribosyltransferase-isomerase QueA [Candidatus Polarisedimenticolaceae bacterium]
MNTSDFDYELPPERIAQAPLPRRDDARLLVLDRASGAVVHRGFRQLPELLAPGDLLVLNDTRVIPARLSGTKPTGGRTELLLLERVPGDGAAVIWRCLIRGAGSAAPSRPIVLDGGILARPLGREGEVWRVALEAEGGELEARLARAGGVPLPPYIRRDAGPVAAVDDRARYQTVYARHAGAVAAPTAGLHFTDELLARLERRGIEQACLTLHVGWGTFQPVRAERIEEHRLHDEAFVLPEATASAVERARRRGGRVIAVGTTVVRTLEQRAVGEGRVLAGAGRCGLFIVPGHAFRVVDAMITNFHLPRSTLLMLVAAFAGRERLLGAYREAIAAGYRFFSYGDAMLVGGTA